MRHVSGLPIASGLLLTASVAAQAQEVALHNINDSGVSYSSALTAANSTFVTSFKGTNDVTETLLGGSVTTSLTNTFPASPGNNPPFLSSFVGSSVQGTGNGMAGMLTSMQLSTPASIQYDFASPLVAGDVLALIDIDNSEVVTVKAYTFSSGVYSIVDMTTAVTATNYTGQTGAAPNANFPTWSATSGSTSTGTWSGKSGNLSWPVSALSFNQSVNRVVVSVGSAGQNVAVQFLSEASPEPGSFALVGMGLTGFGVTAIRRRRRAIAAA